MANSISDSARNHFITSAMAKEMIAKFKGMNEKIIRPEFTGKGVLPFSETFDKAAIQALLDQPGCVKIRTYMGMTETMETRFIFIGVDEQDQDMISATEAETDDFLVVEEGMRCPPDCPTPPPQPAPDLLNEL
jgi:hypothetical protein